MDKKRFLIGLAVLWFSIFFSMAIVLFTSDASLLKPKGVIAEKQYDLLVLGSVLSLIVVIPVFMMLFYIVVRYRERDPGEAKHPDYKPEIEGNKLAETIWWGIPIIIILILSVVTWRSTHELDPYKEIASDQKPLRVQVVALQWKWLFIYPEYDVASLNQLVIPTDRPVNFEITADAPMNSFWIPDLGGQVYAMAGMRTKLSLMANQEGVFRGTTANISGEGFADMNFKTQAISEDSFNAWINSVTQSDKTLDWSAYEDIARPSIVKEIREFKTVDQDLFDDVFHKYGVHYHSKDTDGAHVQENTPHSTDHEDKHEGGH